MHSALASLDQATRWLNSEPLTARGLLGRTVAVDFCTYSCVNWLRTLPYRRAWYERYSTDGLVVVGVHAPEFGFERDLGNVRRAMVELGVPYPVVIDNDFAIWQAFANRYWPALYLVDGGGRLRFHHFGEEAYDTIERTIQQQLGHAGELSEVDAGGVAAAADWDVVRSPETYLGSARGDTPRSGADVDGLALNEWTLDGEWTQDHEAAVVDVAGSSLAYRFHARDLNLVLAPPSSDTPVGFTVRLDGRPPGDAHGLDVDDDGSGLISEPRMYQLIRQHGDVSVRTLEVTFRAPGARVYVFTFG